MRKRITLAVVICVTLLALFLLYNGVTQDDQPSFKALYLENERGNEIFVDLDDGSPFTGTIPQGELYDKNGERITEQELNSGDVLEIYGVEMILESYPAQYPGITKAKRIQKENQKYVEEYDHYLDELFVEVDPAQRP